MTATLRRKAWLVREWDVTTPHGPSVVKYSGWGKGYETVFVNHLIAVRTPSVFWYVPRFDFFVGLTPATVEVRVWPWLALRSIRLSLGNKVCYHEGS